MVAAFIGARFSHVFLYEWPYYREHLGEIIRIDQGGLSSFGGFFGAAVATILLARIRRLNFLKYADVLLYAFPLGWGIGRFGCFLTHMHPGQLSSAWFAVQYPGGARLDMGIIESFAAFAIFVVFFLLARRRRPDGFFVAVFVTIYGLLRFGFDFFRSADLPISDTRYFGLTPAQYGSVALVALGFYLLNYAFRGSIRKIT